MAVTLNPYLNVRDGTREVMTYYATVFSGELTLSTFAETGGMGLEEAEQHKVMHAQIVTGAGLTLMAADVPASMDVSGNGTVSISGDDEADLRGWWDALTDGGSITVPLEKAPWGDTFGMCTDGSGVDWMVTILGWPARPPARPVPRQRGAGGAVRPSATSTRSSPITSARVKTSV
jgi:PhnB protein